MNILQLQESLDEFSSWRKKELSQARSLAENATNTDAKKYLCRCWVLLMYAHCDNFLKQSTQLSLEYHKANFRSSSSFRYEVPWLVSLGNQHTIDANHNSYVCPNTLFDRDKAVCLGESLFNAINKKASFDYKLLRYYCDWVMQINFEHRQWQDFCDRLKKLRNQIAHGEETYIENTDDCVEWHKRTMIFFDDLKLSILDSLEHDTTT